MGGKGSGGHNKKPVERKRRIGNPGGKKLPEVLPMAEITTLGSSHIPTPHRELVPEYGGRLWNQIWSSGAGWLKQNMDTELVLILCEAMQERIILKTMLKANQSLWRERRALREVDRQIITLLGQIGFTPAERGLFNIEESPKHQFINLNQRIAEKRSTKR